MAEIKIRKKKAIWPWVLGIILVLGILIYYLYASNNLETNEDLPSIGTDERIDNGTGYNELKELSTITDMYFLI